MKKLVFLFITFFMIYVLTNAQEGKDYCSEPQEEFENRMQWFTDAKYGMCIVLK